MFPLTKLSTNILDVYLEAGTETILHYLANAYYVIAETKIQSSELQLNDQQVEVDPNHRTLDVTIHKVDHHLTPPHYEMYVDLFNPTDPQIFVIHTINRMINWMNTIHNELYDIHSLRTLNTSRQNSCRNFNKLTTKIITL